MKCSRRLLTILIIVLALTLTGCGKRNMSIGLDLSDFQPPVDFDWEGSYMDSTSGLATLTVDKHAMLYKCTITVPDKSISHLDVFEFTARKDEVGLVYTGGKRVSYDIPDFEKNPDAKTLTEDVYEDGTGTLYYSNGTVYWIDDMDDYGNDFAFQQQSGVIEEDADTEEKKADTED